MDDWVNSDLPDLSEGEKIYRVYGGDSQASGASWTTTDPSTVTSYRNSAGLPSNGVSGANNSGQFVIEGTVNDPSKVILKRKALPLDGQEGGMPEYIIPDWMNNGAIEIQKVGGVNPEF